MSVSSKLSCLLSVCFILFVFNGCSYQDSSAQKESESSGAAKDSHDHGDHENDDLNFGEAVQKLVGLSEKIRDGFTADDGHAAHEPLHQVGGVLEQLGKLAKKEEFGDGKLESFEKAIDELFTAYGNIDKKMHGSEGSDYEDEAEKIQSALSVIRDAAKFR